MAQLNSHKVQASTLLEVVVAMVLILIVFVMAMEIYTHVVGSSPSVKQQYVKTAAENVIDQSIKDQDWKDAVIEKDSLVFQKAVVPYQNYTDLMLIRVSVMEHGQEIGLFRKIVKKQQNEH